MTLPNDQQAERIVLGSIIGSDTDYLKVKDIICSTDFYDLRNQDIFTAVDNLYKAGAKCDMITVNDELKRIGKPIDFLYLIDIQSGYSYDCTPHAYIIHEKSVRRRLFTLSIEMSKKACREDLDIDETITELTEAAKDLLAYDQETIITMTDAVNELIECINKNASDDAPLTGMITGFFELDRKTGGLQGSDLTIVAAETSQGKTSFALSLVDTIAETTPCAIYSLEMSSRQITARLASHATGIPSNELLYSRLKEWQFLKFDGGINRLYKKPIYIDPKSTLSIDKILSSIRRMHAKFGVRLAVVDYLQIIPMAGDVEKLTAQYARSLKNIAKELDIHIVLLSQLNRNENHVPTRSRLRNSGQIEEAADNVVLIYRPEVFNLPFPEPFSQVSTKGYAMIDWAKGRNIGEFKFIAGFNPLTTHFSPIEDIESIPISDIKVEDDRPF